MKRPMDRKRSPGGKGEKKPADSPPLFAKRLANASFDRIHRNFELDYFLL
jgi:hypothetical protein